MSFMGFTGTLSPRIRILSKLTILSLQGNQITGGIPEDYGNLTSLTMLDLENHSLTGSIPSSLGNLKNSTIFDIEPKQSRRAYPRLTIKSTELDEHFTWFP